MGFDESCGGMTGVRHGSGVWGLESEEKIGKLLIGGAQRPKTGREAPDTDVVIPRSSSFSRPQTSHILQAIMHEKRKGPWIQECRWGSTISPRRGRPLDGRQIDMICCLLDGHGEAALFTRLRRFGKTLTMSMPDHFFFIRKKKEGADLFRGMAVEKAGAPI